jgi:hypothetical protein
MQRPIRAIVYGFAIWIPVATVIVFSRLTGRVERAR